MNRAKILAGAAKRAQALLVAIVEAEKSGDRSAALSLCRGDEPHPADGVLVSEGIYDLLCEVKHLLLCGDIIAAREVAQELIGRLGECERAAAPPLEAQS